MAEGNDSIEVIFAGESGITVLNVPWEQFELFDGCPPLASLLLKLPDNIRVDLRQGRLQVCRWGKHLSPSAFIEPGDQIACLPTVKVDPKIARQARVEKQRKAGRTAKYRAATVANVANAANAANLRAKTKR